MKYPQKISIVKNVVITICTTFLFASCNNSNTNEEKKLIAVRLSAPKTAYSIATIIAIEKGFFKKQGLDVKIEWTQNGKQSMDALLSGSVDFATVVETNLAFAGYLNPPISVIGCVQTIKDAAIIARKDKGINKFQDLRGKKIGVLQATTSEVFVHRMLEKNNIKPEEVVLVNLTPPAMQSAIVEGGNIQAISTWQPYVFNVVKLLKDNGVIFEDSSVFVGYMNLVMNRGILPKMEGVPEQMLKAYIATEKFIQDSNDVAMNIVSRRLEMKLETIQAIWNKYRVFVELTSNTLKAIHDEGKWVKTTKKDFFAKQLPEYSKMIEPIYLKRISIERVVIN